MFVSHEGRKWQIRRLFGHTQAEPTKALLVRQTHNMSAPEEKLVLLTDVRQLAGFSPDVKFPDATPVPADGDFVLVDETNALVIGGVVLPTDQQGDDPDSSTITVQQYTPSKSQMSKHTKWQPLWTLKSGQQQRRKTRPHDSVPYTLEVELARIIAKGTVTDGSLDDTLMKALAAKGFATADPESSDNFTTHNSDGHVKVHL